MTGPHIYGAHNPALYSQSTPYTGYYATSQTSPFIPPAEVPVGSYPPSPYRGTSPIPDMFGSTNTIGFPNSYDPAGVSFAPAPYQRPRAPSYHGPPLSASPYAAPRPITPPWVRPPRLSNPAFPSPGVIPGSIYSLSPWANLPVPLPGTYTEPTGAIALHPFLEGQMSRFDLLFNLASHQFIPMQLLPNGTHIPVSAEILSQHATQPALYRMKIVSDDLPHWPVTLEYDPESFRQQTGASLTYPPPITVGDVLAQLHRNLHERISHSDWGQLDDRKRWKISQAYAVRCASNPAIEHMLKNDGVKKVDYLLDKVWFRGLARSSKGPEVFKLVMSRREN